MVCPSSGPELKLFRVGIEKYWVPGLGIAIAPHPFLYIGIRAFTQTTTVRGVPMVDTQQRIDELVKTNKVMVFMKGSKLMPQCGFSNTAVQILNSLGVPFETFDVLSDYEIRQGIKEYSNWPTIPQVYINGEFVGGSDILIELYQKGELQELIAVALAS